MVNVNAQDYRVLFWGILGEFSYTVLEGLLSAAIDICAVVIPTAVKVGKTEPIICLEPDPPLSQLPISQPYLQRSAIHLAWQHQVDVYEIRQLQSPDVESLLLELNADVAVVACFPWRISKNILHIPHQGFLNLHPSLLPELRGPYPLFWTFRLGRQQTGITVHKMDSGLDTGAIALQETLTLPDGIRGPEADRLMASHGAALLVDTLQLMAAEELQLKSQPEGGSSYSRPTVADFLVPTSWTARRAYNFIRGTAEWNTPYHIKGPGVDLAVREAITFAEDALQEEAILRSGRDCWIQFTPGVLHAR